MEIVNKFNEYFVPIGTTVAENAKPTINRTTFV